MTNIIIIVLNLVVLCISRDLWYMVKNVYRTKGLRPGSFAGIGTALLVGSTTAAANTFILKVAEVSTSAP